MCSALASPRPVALCILSLLLLAAYYFCIITCCIALYSGRPTPYSIPNFILTVSLARGRLLGVSRAVQVVLSRLMAPGRSFRASRFPLLPAQRQQCVTLGTFGMAEPPGRLLELRRGFDVRHQGTDPPFVCRRAATRAGGAATVRATGRMHPTRSAKAPRGSDVRAEF